MSSLTCSHFAPRTALLSQFSQVSSSVAYTLRKSVWYFRSSASRSDRLGCLPTTPPLSDGPATNRHEAAPWSVPRLPFSYTRRPNSLKVISIVRWPLPDYAPGYLSGEKTCRRGEWDGLDWRRLSYPARDAAAFGSAIARRPTLSRR